MIELGRAVRDGRLDAVRRLLDAGAEPNQTNFYGDTLIDMAHDRGHTAIAALLEDACAHARRVQPSDARADHPIHVAAERGDIARVRAMLDTDPTLVARGDRAGGTPLHRAVIGRASNVVKLVLDRGADIHAVHGAGLGSSSGYAPEDLQAIDLAIWGGPCRVRSLRAFVAGVSDVLHERFTRSRRVHDLATARLLISRGATYDLTVAAALGDIDHV